MIRKKKREKEQSKARERTFDKKLYLTALLLPITIMFACAAATGRMVSTENHAVPTVTAIEGETCIGVPIELPLQATSPSGNDIMLFQLTEQPRLGTASIAGSTLTYTPGKKTGKDKFSYTAVDSTGSTAKPARITIKVVKNRAKLTYADMEGNPAHYAAITLAERGIMTGEQISGCSFFRPTETMTRSEFIAMAAAAAKLPVAETAKTDFADDSGLSLWAKPFVSTAAANGLVNGYITPSGLAEIRGQKPITLAEASVVINNMLNETLNGATYTLATEHPADMDWAETAIHELSQLDILPSIAESQQPDAPITRQTACEMIYEAIQLMET